MRMQNYMVHKSDNVEKGRPLLIMHPDDHDEFIEARDLRTKLSDWVKKQGVEQKISGRLRNILAHSGEGLYFEDVKKWQLRRIKGIGRKTLKEFMEIRGY